MKKEDVLSFLKTKEPLWGNWIIKEKIGEGSFSVVYRIEARRWDRTDVSALKVELITADGLLMNDTERRMSYIEQRKENIIRESAIMHQLRDDNHIVRYEDEMTYKIIEEGQLKGYIFLIRMEYLKCIYDLITQHQFDLSESNIRKLALEIARGIETIHAKGILHRDIKPGNLFLSFNGEYKLGDFNVSKQSPNARTMAGADGYIAPEIYRAKSRVNETYSTSADIYSFGICLYQFMNDLCFPFESSTTPIDEAIDLRMSGKAIPKPKFASDAFSKIILKACSFSQVQRYSSIKDLIEDLLLLEDNDSSRRQSLPRSSEKLECSVTVCADLEVSEKGRLQSTPTVFADYHASNSDTTHSSSLIQSDETEIQKWIELGDEYRSQIRGSAKGVLNPETRTKAIECYMKAAEAGSTDALFKLGKLYGSILGYGDTKIARKFYLKGMELGDFRCMYVYALTYLNSEKNHTENAKALSLITQAAQSGYAWAQWHLALYYREGKLRYSYGSRYYVDDMEIPIDIHKAITWYERCEESIPLAACQLADIYYYGEEVELDYNRALHIYRREVMSDKGFCYAKLMLGKCYWHGNGINTDRHLAMKYIYSSIEPIISLANPKQDYFKYSKQLSPSGWVCYCYAECLYNGYIGIQNYQEAAWWYKKAESLGCEVATNMLSDDSIIPYV